MGSYPEGTARTHAARRDPSHSLCLGGCQPVRGLAVSVRSRCRVHDGCGLRIGVGSNNHGCVDLPRRGGAFEAGPALAGPFVVARRDGNRRPGDRGAAAGRPRGHAFVPGGILWREVGEAQASYCRDSGVALGHLRSADSGAGRAAHAGGLGGVRCSRACIRNSGDRRLLDPQCKHRGLRKPARRVHNDGVHAHGRHQLHPALPGGPGTPSAERLARLRVPPVPRGNRGGGGGRDPPAVLSTRL